MTLPFVLPERPPVTQIRGIDAQPLAVPTHPRTQPMAGFEPGYVDIVDYIVRITDEIWMDRAIGRIYATYDPECVIYSSYGVVRRIEDVVAGTVTTLNAFPDGNIRHLNVAWSGDEEAGFYTSHLGHSRSTNIGPTGWGPATGRKCSIRFAADCISDANLIHTEWLVRDNGAQVRQLGFDIHDCARRVAETSNYDHFVKVPASDARIPAPLDLPGDTVEGWARHLFHELWTLKRLDRLPVHYASDAVVHAGGGRSATGPRRIGDLIIHIHAAIPGGRMRVEHVSWSEEADGVIVAVRWLFEGESKAGGVLGDCPNGKQVFMMGVTHMRLGGDGRIVEEWMIFDEVGVLAQAYRA